MLIRPLSIALMSANYFVFGWRVEAFHCFMYFVIDKLKQRETVVENTQKHARLTGCDVNN